MSRSIPVLAAAPAIEVVSVTPATGVINYDREASAARAVLRKSATRVRAASWNFADEVHAQVVRLKELFPSKTHVEIYEDLSQGQAWSPLSMKKCYLTIGAVCDLGFRSLADDRTSVFGGVADVVNSGLPAAVQKRLLATVDQHDRANPNKPYTVREVREMIRKERPAVAPTDDFRCDITFLPITRSDSRFGDQDHPDRIDSQEVGAVLGKHLPKAGRFLAVRVGGGTALDVAQHLAPDADFRGFDTDIDERVKAKHSDRVVPFDAAKPDWRPAVPVGWFADVVLVMPPRVGRASDAAGAEPANDAHASDPRLVLEEWRNVAKGVRSVLRPGGVLAVITASDRTTSPVLDLEYAALHAIHESGAVGRFLDRIVARVGRGAAAEMHQIHIFQHAL